MRRRTSDSIIYDRRKLANSTYWNNEQSDDNILKFTFSYLFLRLRQFSIVSSLLFRSLNIFTTDIKSLVVRNMYWGRTSFYKQAFHIIVIIITLSALYSGLGQRITTAQAQTIDNISISDQILFDSDIVSQQASIVALDELESDSDSVYTTYVVQNGDSLEKIAQQYDINIDTIRWANNIPAGRDTLTVGQVVRVPKMNGVLYEVKNGDSVDKILSKVELNNKEADRLTFLELNSDHIDQSGNPIPGRIVFLPEARIAPPPPPPSKPRPSSGGGGGTFVTPPPSNAPSVPAGTFVNPMQLCSYRVSRGYSYGHTGVDLATSPGCKVVAAGSGTVAEAGWCYSLGYCVVIKHANGFSTVYGHGNGVFYVKKGQSVSAGQVTMESGCSGRCFGPHVHLSLAANSQDVYSCYRCRINPAGRIPY